MNKIFLIIVFLLISNCTLNKVVKHHGIHNLKNKNEKLTIFVSNSNDILKILGPPSTKSTFDNDIWIYIERKLTSSNVKTLGRKKLLVNDVLVLEINNKGVLVKKEHLSKNDMNKLIISKSETNVIDKKDTFISTFITSLRHKINDPLGQKKAK